MCWSGNAVRRECVGVGAVDELLVHLHALVCGAAAVRSGSERPVLHRDGDGHVVGDVDRVGRCVGAVAGDQPIAVVPVVGGGAAGSGDRGVWMSGRRGPIGGLG